MTQPTTTPTAEPVPSKRPQDLLFNTEFLDIAMAGDQLTIVDRRGQTHLTYKGAIQSLMGTNPRGAWSATPSPADYALKDLTVVSSVVYICTLPHTPSGSFATDLAAGRWAVHKGITAEDLAQSVASAGLGTIRAETGAVATTGQAETRARDVFAAADRGADSSGSASSTTALNSAATNIGKRTLRFEPGTYKASNLTISSFGQHWAGQGWSSDPGTAAGAKITKDANGPHLTVSADDASLRNLHFDGDKASRTGDGVVLAGSRAFTENLSVANQAGDNIKIGSTLNGNLFCHIRPFSIGAGGKGMVVNHTGGPVELPNYPAGLPDINAGVLLGFDIRTAAGVGLEFGNAIDDTVIGGAVQNCGGVGVKLTPNSHGHVFVNTYSEANNGAGGAPGDEILIEDGATGNAFWGLRSFQLGGNGLKDESPAGKNSVWAYDRAFSAWTLRKKFLLHNPLDADTPETTADFVTAVNYTETSVIKDSIDGTTGGRRDTYTKRDGDSPLLRHSIRANGDQYFLNATGGCLFGKTVADTTTTGTTIYTSAGRIDIVNSGAGSKQLLAAYDQTGYAGGAISDGAGNVVWGTVSDRGWKTKIRPAKSQGAIIDAIMVREYEMRAAPGAVRYGFVADEFEKVMPSAVVGMAGATEIRRITRRIERHRVKRVKKKIDTKLLDEAGKPITRDEVKEFSFVEVSEEPAEEKVHIPQQVDYLQCVPLLVLEIQELRRDRTKMQQEIERLVKTMQRGSGTGEAR